VTVLTVVVPMGLIGARSKHSYRGGKYPCHVGAGPTKGDVPSRAKTVLGKGQIEA
jgi:hypothetical protein